MDSEMFLLSRKAQILSLIIIINGFFQLTLSDRQHQQQQQIYSVVQDYLDLCQKVNLLQIDIQEIQNDLELISFKQEATLFDK